ncbi:MAG: hypothetical protein WDW36_009748 [Sanguina aurantia]
MSSILMSTFLPLDTHPTEWVPEDVKVTLNITLDACIVPVGSGGGARVDFASLVVLDDFFGEQERLSLLDFLTEAGWDHDQGPPSEQWERATADAALMPRTWGLKDDALRRFATASLPAKLEIQSRLCKLYPQFKVIHMPSGSIQSASSAADPSTASGPNVAEHPATGDCGGAVSNRAAAPAAEPHAAEPHAADHARPGSDPCPLAGASAREGCDADDPDQLATVDCNAFVANAAVHGDAYSWHVDADPSVMPHSPWTQCYGHYFNREPSKPLFVSLLLYLNDSWPRELDAETLFLDSATDTGILVRPKKYRAVLMDQDVLHRLSAPSRLAQGRPRYSLVWKLVFLPLGGAQPSIARPEWGPPTAFGSAAKMQAAAKQMASQAKRTRREPAWGQPRAHLPPGPPSAWFQLSLEEPRSSVSATATLAGATANKTGAAADMAAAAAYPAAYAAVSQAAATAAVAVEASTHSAEECAHATKTRLCIPYDTSSNGGGRGRSNSMPLGRSTPPVAHSTPQIGAVPGSVSSGVGAAATARQEVTAVMDATAAAVGLGLRKEMKQRHWSFARNREGPIMLHKVL